MNNLFLLVPPAVLVIMDDPSNFQDFLSFSMCIYTLFKRVSKVSELDLCKSQKKCGYHQKILFSLYFLKFLFRPFLNPVPTQCMPFYFKTLCLPIPKIGQQ